MRNLWLIIQREYLERVRTRSFLILTLLLPAIMTVLMILPAKLATMGEKAQHLVVVTSTQQFGEMVRQRFLAASTATDDDDDEKARDQFGQTATRTGIHHRCRRQSHRGGARQLAR